MDHMNPDELDHMNPDELDEFSRRHGRGHGSRVLFPDGGIGARRATAGLAQYAKYKRAAMLCRVAGDIPAALAFERRCDALYAKLPDFAKW